MMDNEGQPIRDKVKLDKIIKVEGDLNGDGKFDKTDLAIAAKTLAKGKKK